MSNKKYPKIGIVYRRYHNTSAKCRCGEIGKYKAEIEWDYMRGNDETVWACEDHKNDVAFLTTLNGEPQ